MNDFTVDPVFGSLLVALLIAASLIAAVFFFPPTVNDPKRRRWLRALRVAAVIVLVLLLVRPTAVDRQTQATMQTVLVTIDGSRSMNLSDSTDQTRGQRQAELLRRLTVELESQLNPEIDQLDLRYVVYTDEANSISIEELGPAWSADGSRTNLAVPLSLANETAGSDSLAAVLMFGDGTQTDDQNTTADAVVAARALRSTGVPLFTIPLAHESASTLRDASITGLAENLQLYSGNESVIDFVLEASGLQGRPLDGEVELSPVGARNRAAPIARRSVMMERSPDSNAIRVPIIAPEAGVYLLTARVAAQQGERVTSNNQQVAFVEVRDGGGRVLLIEGQLRPETLFIRRAIQQFPDLDLTLRWIPEDTRKQWPLNLRDVLRSDSQDAVILGAVDPAALGNAQTTELATRVLEGWGLIKLADPPQSIGRWNGTPISSLLPTQPSAGSPVEDAQVVLPIKDHPVIRLRMEGRVDPIEVWQNLPPQLGLSPLGDLKTRPGLEVLLTDPSDRNVLAVGSAGRGRVAELGFDSTWRWWRSGYDQPHRQFWRQLLLWSMNREVTDESQLVVEMDSRRLPAGDSAEIAVRTPVNANVSQVKLFVRSLSSASDASPVELFPGSNADRLQAELPGLDPGIYEVIAESSEPGIQPGSISFQVIDTSPEMLRPQADIGLLRQLATQTSPVGGRFVPPEDLAGLVEEIVSKHRDLQSEVTTRRRLADDSATAWPLFLVFAGVLSFDWYLRRGSVS
ncbi:MAG: hypothetical protein AAF664_08390 [Planctomycetota bacterium]